MAILIHHAKKHRKIKAKWLNHISMRSGYVKRVIMSKCVQLVLTISSLLLSKVLSIIL